MVAEVDRVVAEVGGVETMVEMVAEVGRVVAEVGGMEASSVVWTEVASSAK